MFVFIAIFALAEARINPQGPTVVNDFANCINQLIDANFIQPGLLYFVNNNNASTAVVAMRTAILKEVHDKLKYSVKTSKPTKKDIPACNDQQETRFGQHVDSFEPVPLADYFIAVVDRFKDFTYLVGRITRSRSWNPNALFIIVLFGTTGLDDQNISNAETMLDCLFKLNVVNAVVIIPEVKNIRRANIYSWRPYDPPKYCGYYNETATRRLYAENVCERGFIKYKNTIFGDKIPTDMKGCVLNILALQRQPYVSSDPDGPNIEKEMINEIAKRYNVTMQYEILNSFRGEKQRTGEWDGALKDLGLKRGQILLGGIFPDNEVHEDFECSSSYLTDSYTWIVPRAFQKPLWIALFIMFHRFVWLSVVLAFLIIAISWKILAKLSRDPTHKTNWDFYLINTWICNLGFVSFNRPVTQSLRVFYVFINLYCSVLLTAYQTKLIDVLTNPTFEHQLSTVEELVASGMAFGGSEELQDLFYNSTDPLDTYFFDGWNNVIDVTEAMIDVVIHRNFSLLCSRYEIQYISAIMPELSDDFGNSKFYAFERNVFTIPLEMVALKGFPFMDRFSTTLAEIKQCGLNEKVRRHFAGYVSRKKAELLRKLEGQSFSNDNALSINILQGGYLALLFGSAFGSIVLVIEILINSKFIRRIKIFSK